MNIQKNKKIQICQHINSFINPDQSQLKIISTYLSSLLGPVKLRVSWV